ncbi:MAG TPA: hypothetical protein DDX47_05720, partial [Candidatus Jacksonbacteria bacterium]|nr:hypothetical protein [Candidatus Jacksonbacteria bacterium]
GMHNQRRRSRSTYSLIALIASLIAIIACAVGIIIISHHFWPKIIIIPLMLFLMINGGCYEKWDNYEPRSGRYLIISGIVALIFIVVEVIKL